MFRTKNHKLIVVSGITHSGTNVVWNILQSHPSVCGASLETGQLLYWNRSTSRILRQAARVVLPSPLLPKTPLFQVLGRRIDSKLYADKLLNLESPKNRLGPGGEPYATEEIENSILCLKSVNRDIVLNPFFDRLYPGSHFVSLIRDPLAICEGWMRRGAAARQAGVMFRRVGQLMLEDARRFGARHLFIKFEDVLADPFGIAAKLCRFANLEPASLEKIRLKIKPTLTSSGTHEVSFGEETEKYWFDETTIREVLRPDVSTVQRERLSATDRTDFEREAMPVLDRLGVA